MKLTMPRVVVFLNTHTKFREKLGKIVSSSFLHSTVATILYRNDEETIFIFTEGVKTTRSNRMKFRL